MVSEDQSSSSEQRKSGKTQRVSQFLYLVTSKSRSKKLMRKKYFVMGTEESKLTALMIVTVLFNTM